MFTRSSPSLENMSLATGKTLIRNMIADMITMVLFKSSCFLLTRKYARMINGITSRTE